MCRQNENKYFSCNIIFKYFFLKNSIKIAEKNFQINNIYIWRVFVIHFREEKGTCLVSNYWYKKYLFKMGGI